MKKFKCEVTQNYDYEIEIDETIWTEEAIKEWSKSFYDAYDLRDIVEIIAKMKTGHEDGEFIEGFGIPMINGKEPFTFGIPDISHDININIIRSDIDVDSTLIN